MQDSNMKDKALLMESAPLWSLTEVL